MYMYIYIYIYIYVTDTTAIELIIYTQFDLRPIAMRIEIYPRLGVVGSSSTIVASFARIPPHHPPYPIEKGNEWGGRSFIDHR